MSYRFECRYFAVVFRPELLQSRQIEQCECIIDLNRLAVHSTASIESVYSQERGAEIMNVRRIRIAGQNLPVRLLFAAFGLVAISTMSVNAQNRETRADRCAALERQLVNDWQRSNSPQEALVRIDQELVALRRERRKLEIEADKRQCYEEFFIFGRSLKRTEACIALDRDIESARRDMARLGDERDALSNSARTRLRREDLVSELARNGCGETYEREYAVQRRSNSRFSFWEDDDSGFDRGYQNTQPDQGALPFASYRTMCVRLCDGYYFPVSFSTLGSRFVEDEAKCQDQCAAPSQLFVYRNPGEDVEQMVSLDGTPYNEIPNAWRHRKQYVKGCSCKPYEYSEEEILKSEQALSKQAAGPNTSAQIDLSEQPSAAEGDQGFSDQGGGQN